MSGLIHNDGALIDTFKSFQHRNACGYSPILSQQELNLYFRDNKLLQNCIILKPEDATTYLPKWSFEGDTEALLQRYNAIECHGEPLEELDIQGTFRQAGIYGGKYGDGFIFLGIDDGRDPSLPVDEANIKGVTWAVVRHRFEVGLDYQKDSYSLYLDPTKQLPSNTLVFHKSRVLRIPGIKLYGLNLANNGGFNDSILQAIYKTYLIFQKSYSSGGDMVQTHSAFKYKLKGLRTLTKQRSKTELKSRFESILMGFLSLGGLIFDADTEDGDFINRTYGGVDNLLKVIQEWFIGVADMPRNKLFGSAASNALSEAGETERWQWNDFIVRYQHTRLKQPQLKLTKYLLLADGNLPKTFDIDYRPHYQMSEKQLAEIKNINAKTDEIYLNNGVLFADTVADSRFGSEEYAHDIQLQAGDIARSKEKAEMVLNPPEPIMSGQGQGNQNSSQPSTPDDIT